MKRSILALTCAGAFLLTAGCSTSNDSTGSTDETTSRVPLAATSSAAPTTTAPVKTNEAGYIPKVVGEEGGLNCADNEKLECLRFTVTDISWTTDCTQAPDAGTKFLHIAVEAEVYPHISDQDGAGLLMLSDGWTVTDAEGYSKSSLPVATSCNFEAGPFYKQIPAGMKQRGDIVFEVPASTEKLYLSPSMMRGGWEWNVPTSG